MPTGRDQLIHGTPLGMQLTSTYNNADVLLRRRVFAAVESTARLDPQARAAKSPYVYRLHAIRSVQKEVLEDKGMHAHRKTEIVNLETIE
jgi:hypothetical protein